MTTTSVAVDNQKLNNLIGVDAKIDFNDLVNVFVSRYETELRARKDTLNGQLVAVNNKIRALSDELINGLVTKLGTDQVSASLFGVNVQASAERPTVSFSTKKLTVKIKITIPTNERYERVLETTQTHDIPEAKLGEYNILEAERVEITTELRDIGQNLNDLTFKERQVRAKLSEQRLGAEGLEGLINHPELVKLITL